MATPSDRRAGLNRHANAIWDVVLKAADEGFRLECDAAGALDLTDAETGKRAPIAYITKREAD